VQAFVQPSPAHTLAASANVGSFATLGSANTLCFRYTLLTASAHLAHYMDVNVVMWGMSVYRHKYTVEVDLWERTGTDVGNSCKLFALNVDLR